MKTISLNDAIHSMNKANAIIIDVREKKEFSDSNISGSINLPSSSFNLNAFYQFQGKLIILVCQSGTRAKKIYDRLSEGNKFDVSVLENHIEDIRMNQLSKASNGWSVDRQFRFFIGILLLTFILGQHYISPSFILIPIILCTGLIVTSIIDKCYMRMGIAMMPWNKGKKN